MKQLGAFFGIGVGPGPAGFIPVAAFEALQKAAVIFTPRARSATTSIARQCLAGLAIPEERFRDIEFTMDPDRSLLRKHYADLAELIAIELREGRNVAYLTIGDSLTYSTYSYTLDAVLDILPNVTHCTFPGITSYAAAAAGASPNGNAQSRPCCSRWCNAGVSDSRTAKEGTADLANHRCGRVIIECHNKP